MATPSLMRDAAKRAVSSPRSRPVSRALCSGHATVTRRSHGTHMAVTWKSHGSRTWQSHDSHTWQSHWVWGLGLAAWGGGDGAPDRIVSSQSLISATTPLLTTTYYNLLQLTTPYYNLLLLPTTCYYLLYLLLLSLTTYLLPERIASSRDLISVSPAASSAACLPTCTTPE